MYERCTQLARRAVFFARWLAVVSEAAKITSVDLLGGLLFDDDSRAQTIFQLREYFPLYRGCPRKFDKVPDPPTPPLLTDHSKMALRWSWREAGRMGDYWIDTEHFLLGILRVPACRAARYLAMTGLTLAAARKTVEDNKPSRPDYGPMPRWWPIKAWLLRSF